MRKAKAAYTKAIKRWLPVTATALLQAAIQQAYAAPCSTDNSIQLIANSETCTATLTQYEGSTSVVRTVAVTGSNSTLTLLNNTTVNVGKVSTPSAVFMEGDNNTLIAENLTINYTSDSPQLSWFGFDIENSNRAIINGDLKVYGYQLPSSVSRSVEISGGNVDILGNLIIENIGGDGVVVETGGNLDVRNKTNISVEKAYSSITSNNATATYHGDTYAKSKDAFSLQIINGGTANFLTNLISIGEGSGFPTITARDNSTININNGDLTLSSRQNDGIQSQSSTINIKNLKLATIGGNNSSMLNQNGGSTNIQSIASGTSDGYFITLNSGQINIGSGSFTSANSSIRINTDANKTSEITIGALAITNNNGNALLLQNAGSNNLTFNGSSFNTPDALVETASNYSGSTDISLTSAKLNLGNGQIADTSAGTGTVNLTANSTEMTGTTLNGGSLLSVILNNSTWILNDPTNNQASFDQLTINSGSLLKTADKSGPYGFAITGDVNNAGLINLTNNTELGDTLTINGDYVGNNGTVELNTQLAGDNSATDQLIINGNATGSTALKFNNINGQGSFTRTGIQVVQTTTSAAKAFYLPGGYLSAGEYEYVLTSRNENAQDNWYLGSALIPQPPQPPVDPDNPQPPAPLPPPGPEDYIYSPNPGSMIALQQAANTLFSNQLEDREGASTQWLTSEGKTNLWLRAYGASNKYNSLYKQLHTKGTSSGTQIGAAVVKLGEQEQINLGLMAGYGRFDSNTHSRITSRKSSGKLDGFSFGVYGTWYKDPSEQRGFYADSWLLWNHFNNTLKLADGDKYEFKSKGITASLELGNHYQLTQNEQASWWIQPQAQVIFEGVKADKRKDALGVTAKSGKHNVHTRLGAKTYLEVPLDTGVHTQYRPYLELNWLHNSNPHSIVINNNTYHAEGARNQGEVKLGVEGNISQNGLIWANAGYIGGSQSNRTVHGTLGVKFNF